MAQLKAILWALCISALMSACATSQKVQALQPSDYQLSCQELSAELTKLDDAQSKVDENRGVNGTNVAAALFWLPGLAYTFHDAGEANRLIDERRRNLLHYRYVKNCRNTISYIHDHTEVNMKNTKLLAALCIVVTLVGCTTTQGNSALTNRESVASIKEGKTTKADISRMFGAPAGTTKSTDGTEGWVYSYSSANMAPFFASVKMKQLSVNFDKNGVVSSYSVMEQ
jgi:outer membrane protein assembly factor BamE (lipoprotein component of BamABCDE complex)